MYMILNLLVTLKQKEVDEINFNNVSYLSQYIQTVVISACNEHKNY